MGMFDSVYVHCPSCGEEVEFQSKAHDCYLAQYTPEAVPMEIAADLNGTSKLCPKCGTSITLSIPYSINNKISMVVS